jgi:hypothetical protein
MGVGIMRDETLKRRNLNSSYTLGCEGGNDSKPSIGSHGHYGATRRGQTRKTPKDLSACDRGCGEDGGVYDVCIRVCIR